MARKSAILIPSIIAAVAVGGLGIAFLPAEVREPDRTEFSKGTVRLDDSVITVEIADTAAERQRWLTFRQDRLPQDTALLLKYHEPDLHEVWMLNIQYNLDLIWLDKDGNVSITGKIDSVGEPRTVNLKAGGTNDVADAIISDESGSIKLSLWGDDINKVRAGDRVSIENGYINTFKGENSINIGKFGKLNKA